MRLSHTHIRLVHSVIFFLLLLCLGYAIYSAVTGEITVWTWAVLAIIFLEGLVLVYFDWNCPLTVWAENQGADNGSVADIFLPKFLADNLFWISGIAYVIALLLVLVRWFAQV